MTLSSTEGTKIATIEVVAKWHSITISETNPDTDFIINAAPTTVSLTPDRNYPITV